MSQDFDITTEFAAPSEPDATATAPPVVMVHYRKRSLLHSLAWPMVVLILAGAILSHRVRIRDWRGLMELVGRRPSVEAAPPPPSTPEIPTPPKVVVQAEATPPPAPLPPPIPERIVPRPLPAVVLAVPLPPMADPKEETDLAWAEIRREAERQRAVKAEKVDIERDKQRRFADEQRNTELRKANEEARKLVVATNERQVFRDELLRRYRTPGGKAGAAIVELCSQHGVDLGSDLSPKKGEAPVLGISARRELVDKARAMGIPEAKILDDLVRVEAANRAARSGPKTRNQAIILAARTLLGIRLTPQNSSSR